VSSQKFKLASYVVYRHGWNAANQSARGGAPEKQEVCRVNAANEEEARRLALESGVTVYNNQHLSCELASVVDKRRAFVAKRVRPAGSPRRRGRPAKA